MNHQNLHYVVSTAWLEFFILAGLAMLGFVFVLGYFANKISMWLETRRNEKRLTEIWKNRNRGNPRSY